jgi:putative peptidoglycan lipid II flippase
MISFSKLFEPSPTVERGAVIISIVTALGSLLGLLKNSLLGARFGAGTELDLYFAAFRIPDFLYNIFVFSTLSSSFLPIFSDLINQGKERLWEVLSSLMTVFALGLGLAALAVAFFAPQIVEFLAPGFSSFDLERLSTLVRLLMIQPIILSVSNVVAMTLQGFKRFFISSCAPIFYNLGIILGIGLLAQWWGINGVAYGVIIGAFLHLLVQWPSLRRLGFRFQWALRESWPSLKEMFSLMVPRSLALLANNLLALWVVSVSSLLAAGSLAVFDFANTIQGLPQTILALSLITASFPFLSSLWSDSVVSNDEQKKKDFFDLSEKTLASIFSVMIPVTLVLMVFAPVVVRLLLGYGNFSSAAQTQTSLTLIMFSWGLPFQALLMFLIRAFFAMKNTRLPLYSVLVVSFLAVPLIWFGGVYWGAPGMALAMSFGAMINSLFLWLMFKKQSQGKRFSLITQNIRQGIILGIFAAVPGGIVYYVLNFFLQAATLWIFVFQLMVSGLVGSVSLLVALYALKIYSLKDFLPSINSIGNHHGPEAN